MANYIDASVGYGSGYTVNLRIEGSEDWYYEWGWQSRFYINGYALYIERADRVDGLTIDHDWETLGGANSWYTEETDSEGDLSVFGSVVFAKDGAQMSDVSIERGLLLLNAIPGVDIPLGDGSGIVNPQDDRWWVSVDGLNVDGEYAVVVAAADTHLKNVFVSEGALYSVSRNLDSLTVSKLGMVWLQGRSTTKSLTVQGGFVQADANAYIANAKVTRGELFLDSGSSVDALTVSNGGILLTARNASVRRGVIEKGGIFVLNAAGSDLSSYEFRSGATVSINSGTFETTSSSGLRFAEGVIVGYGFDNDFLGYFVGNTYNSVSSNESRNFVATERVVMDSSKRAYNLTIEDGGSLLATGGRIEGLTVRMNFALLSGNSVASDVVVQSPDFLDFSSSMTVSDTAKVEKLRVYDDCEIEVGDQAKLTNVTLNDRADFVLDDTSRAEVSVIAVNDASHVSVLGAGKAKNMTINSGVVEVAFDGKVEGLLMNGGALHSWDGNNRISGIQQYGGTIAVQGHADNIVVHKGGRLVQIGDDTSSGRISNMTLNDGAWIAIDNISTIQGSFDPTNVTVGYNFHSGYQKDGRTSYKYIVSFYNNYVVNEGCTAQDMCISVGNTNVRLLSQGTMINGDIENGCLTVYGNSTMKGKINLHGSTYFVDDNLGFYQAAGINFLSDTAFIDTATFNFVLGNNKQLENYTEDMDMTGMGLDFDVAYGDGENMFDLSLTIDSNLKFGETYSMYLGSGFRMEGIDIYDKNGNFLGTATHGRTLSVDGKKISLVCLNNTNQIYDRQWGVYVESTEHNSTQGDIDGNGFADVILSIASSAHPHTGATGAWLIQNNQTAKWGNLSTLGRNAVVLGTGKLNSSKDTDDILVRNGRTVGAWTTDDKGNVTGWKNITQLASNANVIGLGDFDGNGTVDLLIRTNSGDIGCIFTGDKSTRWNYFQSVGSEWDVAAVGDFNGDGRSDLVLEHDAGFAGCWLTNANGTVSWSDLDSLKNGTEIVGAGDFNGDGTDDVLLQTGNYYGAWIINNGNATAWEGLGVAGGTVEQIADFNGDEIDDLRIRTANGDIGVQLIDADYDLNWKYFGSVGREWNTALAVLQ